MKLKFQKGETSVIATVFIQDSSLTTGAGLASLDQTSSIVGGYLKRNGLGIALAVDENVTTEGTYEAPTTAAQVRIGTPANMRAGTYELHFHNDLFTTADYLTITLGGASNMAPLNLEIQLTNDNPNSGISEYPDGFVYYDAAASNTTTVQGVDGIPSNAVSSLTAVTTIANALGTKKVKVKGILTLNAATVDYTFEGWDGTGDLTGASGMDLSDCVIRNITVRTGATTNATTRFYNCHVLNITTVGLELLSCTMYDCTLSGTIKTGAGTIILNRCTGDSAGTTFDMGGLVTVLIVNDYGGMITLTNMTHVNAWGEVYSSGSNIFTIGSSNTGGSMDFYGIGNLADTNGGTTVTTTNWQELPTPTVAQIADAVWDEDIEAGHGTDATAGLLLRALGSAISNKTHNETLNESLQEIIAIVESQRGAHTHQAFATSNIFFVDPVNGDTHANGNRGGLTDPYSLVQDCHDNAVTDSNHDIIILLSGASGGATTLTEDVTLSKRYLFIRGPGRDFIWTRSGNGHTITVTADGIELSGFQLNTAATGTGDGVNLTDADFLRCYKLWINDTRGDGIGILRGDNCVITECTFQNTGQSGAGQGVDIAGTAGTSNNNKILNNFFEGCAGDAVKVSGGTINETVVCKNTIQGSSGWGANIGAVSTSMVICDNVFGNNTSGDITDGGTNTVNVNNISRETIKAETALILTDTAEIGTAGAGLTDLGGMSTGMKAEVNAEVLDVMNVDTFGEPGQENPGATVSIFTKIAYLYKFLRNKKEQTSTELSVYNDAGDTVDQKSVVSDDLTTMTKGEFITGA